MFSPGFFAVVYGIILIFSLICLWMVSSQKPSEYQKAVVKVLIASSVYMLGNWFSITATSQGETVIAEKLILLSGSFCFYFMFSLMLMLAKIELKPAVRWILRGYAILLALGCFTFDMHGLFYKSYSFAQLEPKGWFIQAEQNGFLFYLYHLNVIGYSLAMFWPVIAARRKNSKKLARQTLVVLLIFVVQSVTYLVDALFQLPVNVAPFGIALGLGMLMFLIYYMHIYDLGDYAREEALRHINAGVLVTDARYRFLNGNVLMLQMFPELGQMAVGEKLRGLDDLHELEELFDEKVRRREYGGKIYDSTVYHLANGEKIVGHMIWLEDVTSRVKFEELAELKKGELESRVDEKTKYIIQIQGRIMMSMAEIIENRDGSTGGHVKRTRQVVSMLAEEMLKDNYPGVDKRFVECVANTAPLHDIGKICIDDQILRKPGKLTDEEYTAMKEHSLKGAQMLETVLAGVEEGDVLTFTKNIAHFHHERWDGKGYPEHLSGLEIPLEARVMAIADVYDALVSRRCYKEPMPYDKADRIMQESFGTSFDPSLKKYYEICLPRMQAFYDEANHYEQH